MSVTIVVGGLRGATGVSKLAAYLALADQAVLATRAASGAEQLIEWSGQKQTVSHLPGAVVYPDARLLVSRTAVIDLASFLAEVERLGVADRLGVDRRATLRDTGSWASGAPELQRFLTDVPRELNTAARCNQTVIIEGAHSFDVSPLYGEPPDLVDFDTTAQACCVQVGLGPTQVDEVALALALAPDEKAPPREEVFGERNRLGDFNVELAQQAALINGATSIALLDLQRRFPRAGGVQRRANLPGEARQWLEALEAMLNLPVSLVSTGPAVEHIVDLR